MTKRDRDYDLDDFVSSIRTSTNADELDRFAACFRAEQEAGEYDFDPHDRDWWDTQLDAWRILVGLAPLMLHARACADPKADEITVELDHDAARRLFSFVTKRTRH